VNRESLGDRFRKSALSRGGKIALSFFRGSKAETLMTYRELDRDSNLLAGIFLNMGVKRGDRVILFLDKSVFFIVAHLAIQKLGAVSIPLNPRYKKSEIRYLLGDAGPALVLAGPLQAGIIRDADIIRETGIKPVTMIIDTERPYQDMTFFRSETYDLPGTEARPEDTAMIIYTSGTTGDPKGVILTQRNLVHDAEKIIEAWEITESDVLCHALPLFHIHGLCFALHTLLIGGGSVVMLDRFSAERAIAFLSRGKGDHVCSLFMAVPAMYVKIMDLLAQDRPDFWHIRLLTSGSAPLRIKDFERISDLFGTEPVEREGMTETGMNFSNPVDGPRKAGSVGQALRGLEVRIVDPCTFQEVGDGQIGEIWLKGPGVTPGYWRKPEETQKAFHEGWLRTGDLGKKDNEGYYYITDRMKHIIISGGENISPKEIESVINRIDDVVETSVVGIPDQKWGEKVVAVVVLKSGSKAGVRDIQGVCREHLLDWKCPKEILLRSELPKNRMGKVLIRKVQEMFGDPPS
jgi:malonyl-CoA/methylmalonyl-CoA synthetase